MECRHHAAAAAKAGKSVVSNAIVKTSIASEVLATENGVKGVSMPDVVSGVKLSDQARNLYA